jgi:hypothetical protein
MPESIFSIGNLLALFAWLLLIFMPRWRRLAQMTAAAIIPGLLAVAYTALIMVWWSRTQGGFNSLAEVRSLLQTPEMLLAGWFHYLAFDLLVGALIARTFERQGIPHLVAVPILLLTFLFGPVGYLTSLITTAAWKMGSSVQFSTDEPINSTDSLLPRVTQWDRRLLATAFVCIAAVVPTTLAAGLDTRTLADANVWLKPIKFQLSVAFYLTTLAAFLSLTSRTFQRSNSSRFIVWGSSFIGLVEIAYITWRASRSEASHFNFSTLVAGILYGLMGIGAVLLSGASLVLAWGITRKDAPRINPVFRLSVILGLILAFTLGGTLGAIMSAGTSHSVGTPAASDPTLPLLGWSRTVGDLRVAHFLGMHVLQILPVIGAIAAMAFGRWARAVVVVAAALYTVVTIALFVQAFAGRPTFPLRLSAVPATNAVALSRAFLLGYNFR